MGRDHGSVGSTGVKHPGVERPCSNCDEVGPDAALYVRNFYADQMWMFVPAQALVAKFLETFKEFPPSGGDSLSVDNVLAEMKAASSRQ